MSLKMCQEQNSGQIKRCSKFKMPKVFEMGLIVPGIYVIYSSTQLCPRISDCKFPLNELMDALFHSGCSWFSKEFLSFSKQNPLHSGHGVRSARCRDWESRAYKACMLKCWRFGANSATICHMTSLLWSTCPYELYPLTHAAETLWRYGDIKSALSSALASYKYSLSC